MFRTLAVAALAVGLVALAGGRPARADEPKLTETINIASSVGDAEKLQAFSGVGVILGQKEWARLAAAWGIEGTPKVDFSKELLLVGTWRGSNFKFLTDVKDGNLTVELVGDKELKPGFRYKVVSLKRDGITKFQGKALPAAEKSELQPLQKNELNLSGEVTDRTRQKSAPPTGVITSQKEWDLLVKDWAIKDTPKVDFTRDVLVVGTSDTDSIIIKPTVKDGDLQLVVTPGKQKRDGFRWRVISVPREGIKTINGRTVPKAPPQPIPGRPPKNPPAPPQPPPPQE